MNRSFLLLASVLLLCSATLPAAADSASPSAMQAAAPVPHASQLIKVSDCNPSLNVMQSGGYAAYPTGWYGGYWRDPYGFNYYQPTVTTTNPQLAIHYMNVSNKVMHEIEFGLVSNGALLAEVRDVGKFSPGAEIKHKLGLSTHAFPIRGIPECIPFVIIYADGSKWRNPKLPPKNSGMYNWATHP